MCEVNYVLDNNHVDKLVCNKNKIKAYYLY